MPGAQHAELQSSDSASNLQNDLSSINLNSKSTMTSNSSATTFTHTQISSTTPSHIILRFCVTADTCFGESILLAADAPHLGSFRIDAAQTMTFEHPGVWTIDIVHPISSPPLRYKYAKRSTDAVIWEAGAARSLSVAPHALRGDLLVRDVWKSKPDPIREAFTTSAFHNVIFRSSTPPNTKLVDAKDSSAVSRALVLGLGSFVVRISVFVERVLDGHEVAVVGETPQLGNGDPCKAPGLNFISQTNDWAVSIALPPDTRRVEYRFLIREKDGNKKVLIEDGVQRELELNDMDRKFLRRESSKERLIPAPGRKDTSNDMALSPMVFAPSEIAFKFPNPWRGAGIALPVFSIRSKNSCGVGEFNDLTKVVDFCVAAGYHLLQLLPINDTTANNTYKDSYPYSAVSSFALHPQYLNIESLGEMPPAELKQYSAEKDRLNALPTVDYVKMMEVKKKYILVMFKLHKQEFLLSKEFQNWFEENQQWLVPYALFRFFMEVNGTSNYDRWGTRSKLTLKEMVNLAAPDSFHFEYLALTYYTKFHLHKQLSAAAKYAEEKQVIFKGDLPIGVNRYCADTWVNPHLFRLHMQAGAPPDFFSKHGQNWLFPTYDWDAMKKDNYAWWRARLGQMGKYFHAYRIDHILGFFRIWEIPQSCRTGMSGRFYPAHAISRQELEAVGLWDIDRYTKPYVRDGILQELFHDDWWKVKDRFFEPLYQDRLKFKDEYDTEKKVEAALATSDDAPESEKNFNEYVTKQLFSLFNNVCLLTDVEDPNLFHPRYMLQGTSSYAELPSGEWKGALYHMHEEYMLRRQDELWKKNGLERLPMMKSASDMLVCGEDLGMIPNCVPSVMEDTSILSLAVQRMPAGDADFGVPSEYKYNCVATTSSHDTSTFRGWWEEISAEMRWKYWTEIMKRDGSLHVPEECTTEIMEWAVSDHLACPAMWTIFPIQDLLGMDAKLRRKDSKEEQINDPSNPDHIWRFRLHLNIEDITENKDFISKLVKLNKEYGRGVAY